MSDKQSAAALPPAETLPHYQPGDSGVVPSITFATEPGGCLVFRLTADSGLAVGIRWTPIEAIGWAHVLLREGLAGLGAPSVLVGEGAPVDEGRAA